MSIIGSAMTHVAIGIRVFNDTNNSTPLLLASFFSALPLMIGGSLAGVFVDRWNRRMILIMTDLGQAVGTGLLLVSFSTGVFQLWHLYAISLLTGTFGMLQRPAMEASVTMLVPDRHRDRANTIRQITGPAAGILAPVITGFAYVIIGVTGVMVLDLLTFTVAITVVILVKIPQPSKYRESDSRRVSVIHEYRGGIEFLWQRRILLYLMIYAAFINFLLSGPITLSTPYIITLTGSEETLGLLLGAMNAGIVVGGVLMMVFGGTRPRVHGIMLGLLFRAAWLAVYGLARTPTTLGTALFFIFFTNALVDASFMSILQAKVPPNMQGRIFALLFQMMYIANPISLFLTGPLVDKILEPAISQRSWRLFEPLVGNRPGSGMGLLMFIAGTLMFISTALIYGWSKTRSTESDLPDFKAE